MARTTPKVNNETLTWQDGIEAQQIIVGTSDWYNWLEHVSTFAFIGTNGTFTARKERMQRGGAYWKAYRKRAGKLHRAYLGKSDDLTLTRMQEAAMALAEDATEQDSSLKTEASQSGSRQTPSDEGSVSSEQSSQMSVTQETIRPSLLPVPLTPLIGREEEMAHVYSLLKQPQVRLVTLIGPGGVGKTRMALEIAHHIHEAFPDGVFFVPLALVREAGFVIATVAQTLNVHLSDPFSLIERMQGKQLLLVLDNLEHLMEVVPQLEQLLLACPGVKMLVTSRTVLHIQGEHELPILPLALPDLKISMTEDMVDHYPAVALFVQRAQAVLPTFRITTENARSVGAICVRLDGLPLALELAAARIKLFSAQALLTRLAQHSHILVGSASSLPDRHQTLHATLQWSYDLLSSNQQWLFRQLCVFVGGATLEAIEAICRGRGGETLDIINAVASLLDHSLLQQSEGKAPRLRMLETIREYGWERLVEEQEDQDCQYRHALYYLSLAESAAPYLKAKEGQVRWLELLVAEQANLRAVQTFLVEQKETELALRLCVALTWYWVTRGSFNEGRTFLEAALALPYNSACTSARAKTLSIAGELAMRQGSHTKARVLLEESVACCSELEDNVSLADALRNLGLVHAYQQQFATARSLIERSIALGRELKNMWLLGHGLDSLARLEWEQGNMEATRKLCEEGLRLHSDGEEIRAKISPRKLLTSIARAQGDYAQAALLARELLALAETVGDQETQFYALFTLGDIAKSQNDDVRARYLYQQSLAIAQTTSDRRNRSKVLSRFGDLALRQGNYKEAVAHYRDSIALARTFEDTTVVGWSLLGWASIAQVEKQYWRAALLVGAAEKRLNIVRDLDLIERMNYERKVASLQTYVGKYRYIQARDEGSKMTVEGVIVAHEPPSGMQTAKLALYPDGLTKREVEILRLVALGWTDTQVAEKLIISPRTVQSHLRSIYNKLDVTSRSAATRFAVEHDLV